MKCFQMPRAGAVSQLIEAQISQPVPGADEILVQIHAAGVTPTELAWYPTTHQRDGSPRLAAIPSHEFSGQITAVGRAVSEFAIGQQVFGMNDWFEDGALAEYCLTQPDCIAARPGRVSHADAASVPIGGLTAWQGLLDRAHLQPGERVLIHGGAGALGTYAIQLAQQHGAFVVTTVSARNAAFVTELGAHEVIDYKACRFEETTSLVDVVFDTVGGETLERSWKVLKPNGRLITIAADSEGAKDERVKQAFLIVEANSRQLREIATLLDTGKLRTVVDTVIPFGQAPDAYSRKLPTTGRGKVVVTIFP